ncbi:MAG: GNAT family N-acetyltransferase [Spirochaetes bacterium]|nr:GNAT family N-acetyltransferase [Spirochaetota bacterium]
MQYQVKKPKKLTGTEIADIHNIISACNKHDSLSHTFDQTDDFKKDSDINTFLLYDKDTLLSVITLFVPRKIEAEAAAFTLPEFRRKGLFSKLLNEVTIELAGRGIPDLLFVCDKNSKDGRNVLNHINADYEYSEYSMKLNPQQLPDLEMDNGLQIREAIISDKPDLGKINMTSFNDSKNEVFSSDKRIFYTLLYHKKIIGMIGIYIEEKKYYIHGFCINPEYRNRGFGRQTLNYMVKKYYNMKPGKEIVLEVQIDNINALSLYKKAGFRIITAYDYLRLPIT